MTDDQRDAVLFEVRHLLSLLSGYRQIDATPEGRLIAQLNWILEAVRQDIEIPLEPEKLSSIRYIYTDGTLSHHSSNPDDDEITFREIELPMLNIINILKNGRRLISLDYYGKLSKEINILISALRNSERKLRDFEVSFIDELLFLKSAISNGSVVLPLRSHLPGFPGYSEVRGFQGNSIDDITGAKEPFKIIRAAVFDGTIPYEW